MFRETIIATAFALALAPSTSIAAWVLDGGQSSVHIVSVKKGKVGEVHSFGSLAGSVKKNGVAKVEITLGSIVSGIAKRDKRRGKLLFEISKYPLATISANLDTKALKGQAVGSRNKATIQLRVDLHGVEKEMSADVIITRLSKTIVSVTSLKPIIIKAGMFNLKEGVAALQKVAKLPSISTAVPTTFDLVFVDR